MPEYPEYLKKTGGRVPVAITNGGGRVYVACDDGTVWMEDHDGNWQLAFDPIPGSLADLERQAHEKRKQNREPF